MDSKKLLYTKIISIISLAVLGYIFFISVYNQIIVQSGGLFYVIIFGGILILAFVLLSLVTKLIEITSEIKDNFMWNFVEILLICNLAYLFFAFRLSYQSSIPAEETIIYRAASLMRMGEMSDKGMDMFGHLIKYPSEYVYAAILSVFMGIAESGSRAMIVLNAIVLIITAFMMDRVVRKIAGRACGVIAALCTLFIPSQSFAVYSYSSEFFFCLIMLLAIDIFLILLGIEEHEDNKELVFSVLLGAVTALLCFTEPLMIICVIIFAVYFVLRKKESSNIKIKPVVAMAVVAVAVLLILTLIKSMSLNTDMGSVISGSLSRFKLTRNLDTDEKYSMGEVFEHFHNNLDNQNTNVNDNYNFLVNEKGEAYSRTQNAWFSLGTQMSYMFVIVMSIACAFYMFKDKRRDAIPGFLLLISSFLVLFFRSTDEASTFFMFQILIIAAGCGLYYMYMNHHPELYAVEEKDDSVMEAVTVADKDVSAWGSIARARALIFAGKGNALNEIPATNQSVVASPADVPAEPAVNTAVTGNRTGSTTGASDFAEATVSPEGYFSFFAMGNAAGAVQQQPNKIEPVEETQAGAEQVPVYEEPVAEYQEQISEYEEPVSEYKEQEAVYEEPEAQYNQQASEYTEPVTEYQETVSEYEEPVAEYQEAVSEYEEPVTEYQETVSEYEEPVAEYQETVSEYEEPVAEYQETVSEYEEPVTEYQETVSEYEKPAAQYQEAVSEYEAPVEEFEEQVAEYAEPTYEEYTEPAYDNTAQNVNEQYVSEVNAASSYDKGTKASYGSAAHALGFSFSNEFFDDAEDSTEAPVYEGITSGTAIEQEMEEPEFDIFGNEIPYEETIQQTATDDAHKPYYASEDEEIASSKVPAYQFAGNYDSDVDEFSFGESMPDMLAFEENVPVTEGIQTEPVTAAVDAEEPVQAKEAVSGSATEAPVRKKKVVKKVVRRVVKKVQPQGDIQEQQPVNLNAEFLQDKELMDIASGYENATLDISSYDEEDTAGLPSLIKENLHKLVQANVPVPDMDENINEIISAEADARYNFDGDGDGDDDGSSSRYIIEI